MAFPKFDPDQWRTTCREHGYVRPAQQAGVDDMASFEGSEPVADNIVKSQTYLEDGQPSKGVRWSASSPSDHAGSDSGVGHGGGVRHGTDLNASVALNLHQARLVLQPRVKLHPIPAGAPARMRYAPVDEGIAMSTLVQSIRDMRRAQDACEDARKAAWSALLVDHPEVLALLKQYGLDESASADWFCANHFDYGTKTAAELLYEGRGAEVALRVGQIAHGVYR